MALRDFIQKPEPDQATSLKGNFARDDLFYEIKQNIHARIIEEINLNALETEEPSVIRSELNKTIEDFLTEEKLMLNEQERRALVTEVSDELMGLGPLEPLLKDPGISDILCNTYKDVFIERNGLLEKTNFRFTDNAHLRNIIDRIISRVGRRIDEPG